MTLEENAVRAKSAGDSIAVVALAFVGVDHKSLLFGLIGAFFTFAMAQTSNVSRTKAIALIVTSAFIGAVCGLALTGGEQPPSAMSMLLSAAAGAFPSAIMSAVAESMSKGATLGKAFAGIFSAKGGE